MREILFRAKRESTNEWVYGYFVNEYDDFQIYIQPQIITQSGREYVNENILGQYTGLTDKNGVKIFEGDIVRNIESGMKALVQFFPEHGAFMAWIRNGSFSINQVEYLGEIEMPEIEVIGNIYDNPELIGEDGEQNE